MNDINQIESAINCPETTTDNNHVIVNDNNVHDSDSDFNIDNVESNVEHDQAFINIKLGPNHKDVRFKVDTVS